MPDSGLPRRSPATVLPFPYRLGRQILPDHGLNRYGAGPVYGIAVPARLDDHPVTDHGFLVEHLDGHPASDLRPNTGVDTGTSAFEGIALVGGQYI